MAQISSAAREPSMEEILASIRRIIEDSDVVRHPVTEATPSSRGTVSEFRRSTPVVEKTVPEKAETVSATNPTETVSKVQQNVEAEQSPAPQQSAPIVEVVAEEIRSVSISEMIAAEVDELSAEDEEAAEDSALKAEGMVEAKEQISEVLPVEPTAELPVNEVHKEDVMATEEAGRILSETTARHISAAFQDLNHAVHAGPRRSFDEIASDILRPMLQDWLDNNLPDLVERLVREEIERVVRGTR